MPHDNDRIHYESMRELRMLVQLHGSKRLINAIQQIDAALANEHAEANNVWRDKSRRLRTEKIVRAAL